MKALKALSILTVATLMSGCVGSRTNYYDAPPAPLPSAPTGNVQTGQLQPIDNTNQNANQVANQTNGTTTVQTNTQETQVAVTDPTPNVPTTTSNTGGTGGGQQVTKTAALGAWNANVNGTQCKLILSLTQNSDKSYRAAPLRCPNGLANVKAWNVEGNQLVLKNSSGEKLVSLNRTAAERYQGGIVTLSR